MHRLAKIKFIKGNISDKTAAVREASQRKQNGFLSQAVDFCLENKEILGNDRELDGLAVAAILSYSPENVKKQMKTKQKLTENFISLFTKFNKSTTVQIAVISKTVTLKRHSTYSSFYSFIKQLS